MKCNFILNFLMWVLEKMHKVCYTKQTKIKQKNYKQKEGGVDMKCAALDIAKYIVDKCVKDGYPISNLQLQKILYYIQKDFLSRGDTAFCDEIEAWQFGPVVPNVYYFFCGNGSMPITSTYEETCHPDNVEFIDKIVEEKRDLAPWDLVNETHRPGGAWNKIYADGEGHKALIPTSLIQELG